VPAGIKQMIISQFFFSIFELGGITKHLMTSPAGNSEFCFGTQNSLIPVGQVVKSLYDNLISKSY